MLTYSLSFITGWVIIRQNSGPKSDRHVQHPRQGVRDEHDLAHEALEIVHLARVLLYLEALQIAGRWLGGAVLHSFRAVGDRAAPRIPTAERAAAERRSALRLLVFRQQFQRHMEPVYRRVFRGAEPWAEFDLAVERESPRRGAGDAIQEFYRARTNRDR